LSKMFVRLAVGTEEEMKVVSEVIRKFEK
jgi:hypothetical protein